MEYSLSSSDSSTKLTLSPQTKFRIHSLSPRLFVSIESKLKCDRESQDKRKSVIFTRTNHDRPDTIKKSNSFITTHILFLTVMSPEIPKYFPSAQNFSCMRSLCLLLNRVSETITNSFFNKYSRFISNLIFLQDLKFNFWQCPNITEEGWIDFSKSLRTVLSVKSLKLHIINCQGFNDKGVKGIMHSAKYLIFLEDFTLNCGRTELTDKGVTTIIHYIKFLRNLRKLCLEFQNCEKLSGKDIYFREVGTRLKSQDKISTLSINLLGCNNLEYNAYQKFAIFMQDIANLQKLEYYIGNTEFVTEFEDHNLEFLKNSIIHHKNLKHMNLEISKCHKVTDEGFQKFFIWTTEINLIIFEFTLNHCNFKEAGISGVFYAIKNLKNLTRLKLEIFYEKKDMVLYGLLPEVKIMLSEKPNLAYLALNLPNLDINSINFITLVEGLVSVKSLKNLSLSLKKALISVVELNCLQKNIQESMPELESLSLNFYDSPFRSCGSIKSSFEAKIEKFVSNRTSSRSKPN